MLRFLRMSWGLRPCWVEGFLHTGVDFLQRFPVLETICLVVSFGQTEEASSRQLLKSENQELRRIHMLVQSEFRSEQRRATDWKPPQVRVVRFRQPGVDSSENI